jgi:hypothetical protein
MNIAWHCCVCSERGSNCSQPQPELLLQRVQLRLIIMHCLGSARLGLSVHLQTRVSCRSGGMAA